MHDFIFKDINKVSWEENELVFIKKLIEKDNYKCLLVKLKPEKVIPLHKHDTSNQSVIFLEGEGEYIINKKKVKVLKDTVVFIEAGSEHSLKNLKDKNLQYIEITTLCKTALKK
ncbi:MAG: cupin domain-containing protein [Actinobacteria bacterium]|nr:cupin domain-containing protein [Actinomycetota bacterium]